MRICISNRYNTEYQRSRDKAGKVLTFIVVNVAGFGNRPDTMQGCNTSVCDKVSEDGKQECALSCILCLV